VNAANNPRDDYKTQYQSRVFCNSASWLARLCLPPTRTLGKACNIACSAHSCCFKCKRDNKPLSLSKYTRSFLHCTLNPLHKTAFCLLLPERLSGHPRRLTCK